MLLFPVVVGGSAIPEILKQIKTSLAHLKEEQQQVETAKDKALKVLSEMEKNNEFEKIEKSYEDKIKGLVAKDQKETAAPVASLLEIPKHPLVDLKKFHEIKNHIKTLLQDVRQIQN